MIRSEIVDDYEFGWKGTVLDGNLYAEVGVYWMDYENMQMSALVPGPVTTSGGAQNLGDSEIKGIEGSVRAFIGNLGLNLLKLVFDFGQAILVNFDDAL